jgi:hypothetical protein
MSEEGIKFTVYPLPSAMMLQHDLSPEMVNLLNKHLNNLRVDENKTSSGDILVGQIYSGEQLNMDHKCDELKPFTHLMENLGVQYIEQFVKMTRCNVYPKRVEMDRLWSVHSYAGDYNPIHDHGTQSLMGVSFTTWTMVPPQIKDNKNLNLYNSSGAVDGYLNFVYGLNQTLDPERLRPSQARIIKPEVGKLLMFPSWLQHSVYPFKGSGERRTVAGNLNCWDVTPQEIEESKDGI